MLNRKEYLKEINYDLGLFYLIENQPEKYQVQCEIVKTQGMDIQERDREALYDASLDYPPDVNLVKARLSLDGGYLENYREAIQKYEANQDNILGHQLEYYFLTGRYEALQGNTEKALQFFNKVIELGEDEDYYFASEAALRAGYIYKEQGNSTKANEYFKKCIKLSRSDYYEYIEDKARKAIIPG